MGWKVWGSNPGKDKVFISSPKSAVRFWGLPSVLFNGYPGFCSGDKAAGA